MVDGWWLDRVVYRGEDVTDVPTELRSSAAGQVDLLVVFTNRAARVTVVSPTPTVTRSPAPVCSRSRSLVLPVSCKTRGIGS